jgi:hypothetical protein
MKRTLLVLLLTSGSLFAQDRIEYPVTVTSTNAVLEMPFTLGDRGYLDDVFLQCGLAGGQTGTVVLVNTTLGFTNAVGPLILTNQSVNRVADYPVMRGDILRVTFTSSATNVTNSVFGWFKNVIR